MCNHPGNEGSFKRVAICRRFFFAVFWEQMQGKRAMKRQVEPWNASGIASPRFGHLSRFGTSNSSANLQSYGVTSRSRHAASRGVTHHQGSVQALPWSCLIPIHPVLTEPSLRISSGFCFDNPSETHWVMAGLSRARIVHGSLHHREDQ